MFIVLFQTLFPQERLKGEENLTVCNSTDDDRTVENVLAFNSSFLRATV